MGTLLSFPRRRRLIFFWWVSSTVMVTAIAKALYKGSCSLNIKSMKTANATLAIMELKDTNLVR
jgi:hypothetical protein